MLESFGDCGSTAAVRTGKFLQVIRLPIQVYLSTDSAIRDIIPPSARNSPAALCQHRRQPAEIGICSLSGGRFRVDSHARINPDAAIDVTLDFTMDAPNNRHVLLTFILRLGGWDILAC